MCRWIAYWGAPVYLDELLFKPENSLIHQAIHARKSAIHTNGDGFGVGWYGERAEPGLYRDLRPAWNDENLRSLAEQIRARVFFAHVRASTGTAISRANCHPFRHGRWLFMHNGAIGGFDRIARELDFAVGAEFYRARQGTTDSETFFYLLLTHGVERDPAGAFARTVSTVLGAMNAARITEPLRITCALTDGERIYALRWSSDGLSPTLFHGSPGCTPGPCRLVLSEPLDAELGNWTAVPEAHLVIMEQGKVATLPFAPVARAAA